MEDTQKISDYNSYPIYVISRYASLFAFLGHLIFLLVFLYLGVRPLVYINIGSCAVFSSAYFLNKLKMHRLILALTFIEIVLHATLATLFLGWASGFYIYILCLLLLVFVYRILSPSWKYSISTGLMLCLVFLNLASRTWPVRYPLPRVVLFNIELMNTVLAFVVLLIISAAYSVSAMQMERQLRLINEELDSHSRLDPLTGLSNRRDIMDKILIEKARISRNATSCCFILADIDHFKKINDQYGHDFGDCVLKQLSDILRGSLRSQDYVCRWGGEEFLMVLPDTNIAGATVAAEKLRQKVENSPFSLEKAQIKVTLTMGIALYDSLEDVTVSVHHADTLLYQGKKNGRNRVEVA